MTFFDDDDDDNDGLGFGVWGSRAPRIMMLAIAIMVIGPGQGLRVQRSLWWWWWWWLLMMMRMKRMTDDEDDACWISAYARFMCVYIYTHVYVHISIYTVYVPVYLLTYLPIYLSIHLSTWLSVSVSLSISLFICLWFETRILLRGRADVLIFGSCWRCLWFSRCLVGTLMAVGFTG